MLQKENEDVISHLKQRGYEIIKQLQIIDKEYDENDFPDPKKVISNDTVVKDLLLREPRVIDYKNLRRSEKEYLLKRADLGQESIDYRLRIGWTLEDAYMIPKACKRPVTPRVYKNKPQNSYNLKQLAKVTGIPAECITDLVEEWLFPEPSIASPMTWNKETFPEIKKFVRRYLKKEITL